jgi:arylsulfatase A-like enzyme
VTAGLRGRKRSLYDGGVRVPALAEWPGRLKPGSVIDIPCSTLDYFPTVATLIDYKMPDDRAIDGQDILPILSGQTQQRDMAIPFRARGNATIVKDRYKLVLPKGELYNLPSDWSEENNVAAAHPERVERMTRELMDVLADMQKSHAGGDYDDPSFKPVDEWNAFGQGKKKK